MIDSAITLDFDGPAVQVYMPREACTIGEATVSRPYKRTFRVGFLGLRKQVEYTEPIDPEFLKDGQQVELPAEFEAGDLLTIVAHGPGCIWMPVTVKGPYCPRCRKEGVKS